MTLSQQAHWIAFAGSQRIAQGEPRDVAARVKAHADAHPKANLLIFDAQSSQTVEVDLRGSPAAVLRRIPSVPPAQVTAATATDTPAARAPGRPKLGVVAREVTLLPRHWDWLGTQPGGASVALRKLVEHAQRANHAADATRRAQDAAYRFMTTMAGDAPGYEEATRALFARDLDALRERTAKWPRDVRKHALALALADVTQSANG